MVKRKIPVRTLQQIASLPEALIPIDVIVLTAMGEEVAMDAKEAPRG